MCKYEWVLLGDYGQGYEAVTTESNKAQILQRLREYLENDAFATGFKIERNVVPCQAH